MKFSYKFSNLLGTVYRTGNLLFTSDGNSVISPVGNRITIYNLKNNKSNTLPVESRYNYTALDLSPNGCMLIAVNEEGEAHMISLISQTIVHKYRFKRKVNCVKFSPDSKHFAVCKENKVFVFEAPGPFTGQYNAFIMERVFHGSFDETTCLDWSFDSEILAIGSKDATTKIYPIKKWKNFRTNNLGSHTSAIVGCFFEEKNYDTITIGQNGQMCLWECSLESKDLISSKDEPAIKKQRKSSDSEDDIDITKAIDKTESEITAALAATKISCSEDDKNSAMFFYKRIAKHYLADDARKNDNDAVLTATAYHKQLHILVTGFSHGVFFVHQLPDVCLIHSLNVSSQPVCTISLNNTGDWIALGCGGLGQLLVWEWQNETYVMNQQGHTNNTSCVCYSTDGQILATGGEDGKIKLWNVQSGNCFVTFDEHEQAITALSFSGNKKFFVSSSLDGTVRAFDVHKYRNFRTFSCVAQFACVAVDSSGEFVAAGCQTEFNVYLWSVKSGHLLEILSGHEGPVCSLAFSPTITSTVLASVSWDKTLRIWDAIEKGSAHESLELTSDGTCVAFKPDGQEVAVATLDGQISFFDVKSALQNKYIEGRNDLGSGKSEFDLISAKKNLEAKAFTSLCYSADGECILAGGQSKNVCIYNIREGILIKKLEITQNRSLDAVDDFINRRKLTEFGSMALIEEREDLEGGNVAVSLPGVKKGDMVARNLKPEIQVFSLQFSPTGEQWAAATTEGLLIYSLTSGLVFDPWDLQIGITPASIRAAKEREDYKNALVMALKLNEVNLLQEIVESIPINDVELTVADLGEKYIERLLVYLANTLDSSRHLEYYLYWVEHILTQYGPKLKQQPNMTMLLSLEKSLSRRHEQLSKISDFNKYTMQYVARLGEAVSKKPKTVNTLDSESEDEGMDMDFDSVLAA